MRRGERAQVGGLRADERGVGGAGIAEGEDERGQRTGTTRVMFASMANFLLDGRHRTRADLTSP
jgi:hypothetical protein